MLTRTWMMRAWMLSAPVAVLSVAGPVPVSTQAPRAPFETHTIVSDGLRGGYQTLIVDLNRDRRLDVVGLAMGVPEVAWYENTGRADAWPKHVLAAGLPEPVNMAAHDLDGDGVPELAVASGFATAFGKSAGLVSIFTHGPDVTAPWTAREIDRTPTAHRVRWVDVDGRGTMMLVNSPLIGSERATPPDYRDHVPVYAYQGPDWKRQTITSAEEGVVHGLFVTSWGTGPGDALLVAGFTGVHAYRPSASGWSRTRITAGDPTPWPKSGASDVAVGRLGGSSRYLATIEPWHGHQVAVYRQRGPEWTRQLIDVTITDGHTLSAGDVDADGRDEIIVGERGGRRSVYLYRAKDDAGATWEKQTIDDGGMGAAGCALGDIDGDGAIDIACIGTATANLKWYRNVARPSRPRG